MKKEIGFTIIELVVVIAIIAILAAIVIINVNGYLAKARNVKRLSDIQNYVKAFSMYYADNYKYPDPDNGSNYCCLGNNATLCWNNQYSSCTNVNNGIKIYFPGLPASDNNIIDSGGFNHKGYLYNNGPPLRIFWSLEGTNQSCGVGTVTDPNFNGVTNCAYYPK